MLKRRMQGTAVVRSDEERLGKGYRADVTGLGVTGNLGGRHRTPLSGRDR